MGLAFDLEDYHPSVLLHCWLGHLTCKIVSGMTYNVSSGTLDPTVQYNTCRFSGFVAYILLDVTWVESLSSVLLCAGADGEKRFRDGAVIDYYWRLIVLWTAGSVPMTVSWPFVPSTWQSFSLYTLSCILSVKLFAYNFTARRSASAVYAVIVCYVRLSVTKTAQRLGSRYMKFGLNR